MNPFNRATAIGRLKEESFDTIVIGAGMTGAGVALDAAQRGLKTALIEASDIASGTSSKSSKMVHGGLRYLQQREFRLVYENLRERQRLLKNAPHLVRILPFLIPLFGNNGAVSKAVIKGYGSALRLYDLTGGWRIGRRYQRVTKDQALGHLPTLNVERLVAGFLYFDARGDDARIAMTIARTAADSFGATVANYVRAIGFTYAENGEVNGVHVRDAISGESWTVSTRSVVNATGVWVEEVTELGVHRSESTVTPAKGVHVSVPKSRLPADVASVLAVPGDRRSIFVVPFEEADFTFIGTTDTPFDGDINNPLCTPEDITYLLNAVNASTSSNLTTADITGVWAGLRPLLAPRDGKKVSERTSDLSRRHSVTVTKDHMVHVTGGKWTTYREMAEDTVDELLVQLHQSKSVGTVNLRLFGAPQRGDAVPAEDGVDKHLYERFGTARKHITDLIATDPTLGKIAIEGLPYRKAEFVYSARDEMAVTLTDLLARRTRAHIQDARATLRAAASIAALVAPTMGWDTAQQDKEVASYRQLVETEFSAAGLSI
ncbi:MAG: glycerol-3-phosphate dehydrogenase/oxidase [Actinobacteria bacterium]|nr:glycerol-3-phosphate dehydrogenase/oxidase [Actinomycetota bacterium]